MTKKSKKTASSSRRSHKPFLKFLHRIIRTRRFAVSYVVICLSVLLGSTIFWSILSARIQQNNADQLVDPYLFQNASTFHGATFPGAHSYLIKWPIFLLIRLFGYSSS